MAISEKAVLDARLAASEVLDSAYGFDLGPVLFKPTLSGSETTFRTPKPGALSYFVGHDPNYPLDSGFGIIGSREVTSQTAAHFIHGDIAMWTGWATMTDKDGKVIKVDKSLGGKQGDNGNLKIALHHSSLPYSPEQVSRV